MASRGSLPRAAKAEQRSDELADRNDAPLTVRLKEPAGSTMQIDVRLRVDYFTGTVEARAKRVVSCLLATAEGMSLSKTDRTSLESQLRDWLARNATALLTGSTLPRDPSCDTSEFMFSFQRSAARDLDTTVPPPRPLPETETPAGPTAPSGASKAIPRRRSGK